MSPADIDTIMKLGGFKFDKFWAVSNQTQNGYFCVRYKKGKIIARFIIPNDQVDVLLCIPEIVQKLYNKVMEK